MTDSQSAVGSRQSAVGSLQSAFGSRARDLVALPSRVSLTPTLGKIMGIERNDRQPKRRRTTAQRMKGRMVYAFELPSEAPKAAVPKPKVETKAAAPKAEKEAAEAKRVKVTAKKPAAKKAPDKKAPAKKAPAKKTATKSE